MEISRNQEIQARLREELRSLQVPIKHPSAERQLPHVKELDAQPILHAVIKESLRLRPTVPVGQPRLTPRGTTTLGGFTDIPQNVRVNAFAWSIHRNPKMFPDPEKWKPERWLVNDATDREEGKDNKDRWFWAFGSGPRMCVHKENDLTLKTFDILD